MATKKIKMSDLKKIIKEEVTKIIKEKDFNMMGDMERAQQTIQAPIVGQFTARGKVSVGGRELKPDRRYAVVDESGKLKVYDMNSASAGAKQWLGDTSQEELQALAGQGQISLQMR